MRNPFTKQNRLGFTLAEVLTVIGILVIVLALGVTGFLGLRKNIRITQYDDIARQIYIAAQNELTRLSVGGMDSETADTLSLGTSMGDTAPEDYDADDGGAWSEDNYKYVTDSDAYEDITDILLPFGSVTDDIRSGHYVIEYNVKTNVVYGVFYSGDIFQYASVSAIENIRTEKSVRKNQSPMVGYYGGSAVWRDEQNYCETPVLTIDNGNELKLTITGAEMDYDVTVTICDASGNTVTLDKNGLASSAGLDGATYTLLLDSLEAGSQFKDLFPGLTPGDDLDITVTFSKSDNSLLPSSATAQTNSLFAARETGDAGDTVTLACARHLQNLDTDFSGLTNTAATGATVKAARQTEDIDWPSDYTFVSIDNEKLTVYDGGYQEIVGLNGTNGLFKETAEKTYLSNIRVVNPTISAGSSTDPVGGLVGTAGKNTTVTGCGVYCYSVDEDDGSIDFSAYTGCGITANSATIGGLIGSAESCTIKESFAALPALSGKDGAGLIGNATYCTVSLSYAACDELDDNGKVNYFLSGSNNIITQCYAVGNLAGTDAAGFAGGSGNIIRQSYYAVSHTDYSESEANDLATTEYVTYNSSGAEKTCTYEQFLTSAATDVGKVTSEYESNYDTFTDVTAPLTHPYREELSGRAYPYPGFYMLEHYGSWPTGDGTVTVTVLMKSSDASDYRYNAGHVQVYELDDDGTTRKTLLFDNMKVEGEDASTYTGTIYTDKYDTDGYKILDETSSYVTFAITPGTELEFAVNEKDDGNPDYTYVSMTGLGESIITDSKVTASPGGNATVTVLFQPSAFALTANYPTVSTTDENGETAYLQRQESSYSVQYSTATGSVVLTPPNTAQKVSTDSSVTITVNYPTGTTKDSYTPVVTYTFGDETVQLTENNGKYTFEMPAADTTIDVCYVKNDDMVQVNVEYYVQGTAGVYPGTAAKAEQRYYMAGTKISETLAEALSEASGKEAWEDNGAVQVLDYSCFELYDASSTLLASTMTDLAEDSYALLPNEPVTLKIYIARAQYNLTLAVGENIQSVSIIYTDGDGNKKTKSTSGDSTEVSATLYYGQTVTASALTEAGQTFTVWETENTNFRQSSAQKYTFTMPYYDFTLTASAKKGYCLVTLELTEDGESWLASSDSREVDPVTLYLVDTRTGKKTQLENKTQSDNSYVAQGLVPAVEDLGEGYNILIHYENSGEEYTYKKSDGETDYQLTVRAAVTKKVEFYTVTYRVKEEGCTGAVPDGGTYPANSTIQVKGNTGLLKYGNKRLIGWKDEDATSLSTQIYSSGDAYTVTNKTYFFAQWSETVKVVYTYEEDKDVSGELPMSRTGLNEQDSYTVEAGGLTCPGYTFAGWSCSYGDCEYTNKNGKAGDGTAGHVHQAGDVITLQSTTLTLTAAWTKDQYTVTYHGTGKTVQDESEYTIDDTVTLANYDADTMGSIAAGKTFVGWATQKGGTVRYSANETMKGLTDDLDLYAVFAEKTVRITYHYTDDTTAKQLIAWGASAILNPGMDGVWTVTAWSDNENCTGQGYLCEEGTAHTIDAYSFTPDDSGRDSETGYYEIDLYANTGRVYNSNQYTWYNTLYDAVDSGTTVAGKDRGPDANDTLIVYRDTTEPNRIVFATDLYVIANGDRTVAWDCDETLLNVTVDKEKGEYEFCGCMFVDDCAVTFGESALSDISGTLTFDAGQLSRVMALKGEDCVFKMVDGVTLTNGLLSGKVEQNARISPASRRYMGGGVYAADGAYFNMAGGTISYCQATAGGGVYIVGQWETNKWGSTSYSSNTYDKSAKFSMGGMETPEYYSSDKIYYKESSKNDGTYEMATGEVTVENYRDYYVTTGNPQIVYNTAKRNTNSDGGGGIVLLEVDSDSLNLFSGAISNNTAANLNGGGIILDVCENNQQLRLYEVEISHNSAQNGGGIYQYQGTTFIYNGDILQNYASGNGGGIYVTCASTYKNSNSAWTGNHEISEVLFYYGTIRGNQTAGNGGGIYLTSPDSTSAVSVYVEEGQILNNSAYSGGGIYVPNAQSVNYNNDAGEDIGRTRTVTVTVDGGEIKNNSTDRAGGGIYVDENGILYLNGGYLSGNTSEFNNKSSGFKSGNVYACDIYLGGKTMSMYTQTGNLAENLENDSDDPVYVMCYEPASGRKIVSYVDNAVFNRFDADCFAQVNGPSGFSSTVQLYVTPTVSGSGTYTYKAPLILSATQSGLCNVSFDYNYDGSADPYTEEGTGGEKILYSDVKSKVTRDGYDLVGWTTTADAELEDYIIYYQDGAAYLSYDAASKHWTYQYEEASKTWYKWNSAAEGWTKIDAAASEIESISSGGEPAYTVTSAYSQTLYAQWQPYSVTYDPGDAPSTVTMTDSKAYGPTVTLASPSDNTYTSENGVTYTFKGWSTESGKTELGAGDYEAGTQITLTKSITLHAVWQPDVITITYNENGGSTNNNGTHTEIVAYGQETTAWDNTTDGATGTYSRSGMLLAGWATRSDGEAAYAFGDVIDEGMTKSNLSLYAVWKDIVTVNFDTDGGSSVASLTSCAGGAITLPNAPARDGYTFVGWSYGEATYEAGVSYTLPDNVSGTITFTAVWKESSTGDNTDTGGDAKAAAPGQLGEGE